MHLSAGDIEIVPAQPEDAKTVCTILDEAAHWLLAKGIAQWQPGEYAQSPPYIGQKIAAGGVYLARRAASIWRGGRARPSARSACSRPTR